jgi:hypothetical protein
MSYEDSAPDRTVCDYSFYQEKRAPTAIYADLERLFGTVDLICIPNHRYRAGPALEWTWGLFSRKERPALETGWIGCPRPGNPE